MKKTILLLCLLLVACGGAENGVPASPAPVSTQTPYVLVVTATAELSESLPLPTDTPDCAPRTFTRMTVGYLPGLDIGDKKSPVSVNMGCAAITIVFEGGASITGIVAEDGLSLLGCTVNLPDGHVFPCSLSIPAMSADNPFIQATGSIVKKSTKELICISETSGAYSQACGG